MNTKHILGLCTAAGLGAAMGSAVVYFLMDRKMKLMEDAYSDKFEAELAETKALYKRALHENDETPEITEEDVKIYEEKSSIYIPKEKQEIEVNYNTMFKSTPKDEKEPYYISFEEFGEKPGYDSVSIYLYDDGVMAYDDNDYVDEAERLLGHNFMDACSSNTMLKDVTYIRNEAMTRDYEVVKRHCTYESLIEDMEPRIIGG